MENNKFYKEMIEQLVKASPLGIDTDIKINGKVPTTVSSEFITNKEQGDWAERIVRHAINQNEKFVVVHYGRSDEISAGDEGFKEFYEAYQNELNTIGKKPDLLIYSKNDYFEGIETTNEGVSKAICAIEVRSSSFIVQKYNDFMSLRNIKAINKITELKDSILYDPVLSNLLMARKPLVFDILKNTTIEGYRNGQSFTFNSLSSTPELSRLSSIIKEIKENIKIIKKRDYLSITPKLEDIALVNRWIQTYNVPHYYLQVFFDKAYIISFENILKISSNSDDEGSIYSIERDTKNQGKTTIKIDVNKTDLVIDNIEIPNHYSKIKELDRGRLLFYIRFDGVSGDFIGSVFDKVLV